MKKMLVAGSLNLDLVIKTPVIPKIGETVMGTSMRKIPGGKGANQACACGRMGADTIMLGAVGEDEGAVKLKKSLEESGVDVDRLMALPGGTTGTAFICVDMSGNNNIIVVPGANMLVDETYLRGQDELFVWCDALLLQMEIPFPATLYAAKRARELNKVVMFNLAPVPDFEVDEIFPYVDYLSVNESELEKITGMPVKTEEELSAAGSTLLRRGVKHVLITIGARGAMLVSAERQIIIAPPSVKVMDTTAAGDTFNAAFMVKLSEGLVPDDAIRFANAAASLTVSREGAQSSIPTLHEVETFLQLGCE